MREKETSLWPTCVVFTENHIVGLQVRQKTLLLDCQYWNGGPHVCSPFLRLGTCGPFSEMCANPFLTDWWQEATGRCWLYILSSSLSHWLCYTLHLSVPEAHSSARECLSMSVRRIWILFLVLSLTFLLQLTPLCNTWLPFIFQRHGEFIKCYFSKHPEFLGRKMLEQWHLYWLISCSERD